MTTGEKIKYYCDKKGITQRELADGAGVTEVSMSRYISDNRVPKAPVLAAIASVLNVSMEDLMPEDENNIIKPCPFCGNENIEVSRVVLMAPFLFFKCKACGATVSFDNEDANMKPEHAKRYWNNRRE